MVTINRGKSTDQGTLGVLAIPGTGFVRPVIELPWRDNVPRLSCIPAGRYVCRRVRSPRFGGTFMVCGVPDRSAILFHGGNYAGATDKGFKSHSLGCILVGSYPGMLGKQRAVLASATAFREFKEAVDGDEFELEIREAS